MASHILLDALQRDSHLADILSRITPAHTLDAIAAVFLGAVGAAYLFPKWTWDKPDPYEFIYYERPQSDEGEGATCNATRDIATRLEELVSGHNPFFFLRHVFMY